MNQASARRAFVSLGANLGDRLATLRRALEELDGLPATRVLAASPVYETDPQDLPDQPPFLNQVACLETGLAPLELLHAAQRIEDAHRRERTVRFGPRTLDVDILLFEGVTCDEPELTLPHPRLWQRAFVLVPLADLWALARAMPAADVAALASSLATTQCVRLYAATEE